MHPDVSKLLDLQRIDQEIARITRDVASLPAERTKRVAVLDRLRVDADAAQVALQSCEVQIRETELAIKQADTEIKRLEERLNSVTNNAEYQATLLQISSVKRDRNQAEEDGLEHIERVDELRSRAEEAKRVFDEEQKTLEEFDVEAEKLRLEREEEVKDVRAKREAKAAEVTPELRQLYERLAPAREGNVVVAVEGGMCLGCYTQITPNSQARLMSNTAVVQCGACQRILYQE